MSGYPWLEFAVIFGLGLVGALAGLPYIHVLSRSPKMRERNINPPGGAVVLVNYIVQLAVSAGLGLLLAERIGLGAPVIRAALKGENGLALLGEALPLAIILGTGLGLAALLLDLRVFAPRMPVEMRSLGVEISLGRRLLTPFAGGLLEEIILRLFGFSLLAWVLGLIWHTPQGSPTEAVFWGANFAAALLFGLMHLPATAAVVDLSPLVVGRGLLLNGLLGLVFGYLYWQYGLVAAMVAHFCADVVIHIVGYFFVKDQHQVAMQLSAESHG